MAIQTAFYTQYPVHSGVTEFIYIVFPQLRLSHWRDGPGCWNTILIWNSHRRLLSPCYVFISSCHGESRLRDIEIPGFRLGIPHLTHNLPPQCAPPLCTWCFYFLFNQQVLRESVNVSHLVWSCCFYWKLHSLCTASHDRVYSAFHCSSSAVACFWKDGSFEEA